MGKFSIVLVTLVSLAGILAYAIYFSPTPLSEQEKARVIQEIEAKTECSGYGNNRTCKVPIFENPIFRVMQVHATGEENGYSFSEEYLAIELTPHKIDLSKQFSSAYYKKRERELRENE